jgi:hypothetical protein
MQATEAHSEGWLIAEQDLRADLEIGWVSQMGKILTKIVSG